MNKPVKKNSGYACNLIYPLDRDDNFTPDYLQSIELVLKSYNIDIESLSQPLFDYETSLRFYHFYHDNLTPNLKRGLIILRNLYHNNKKLRVKVIEDKYQYPEKILNDLANQKILQEDIDNILKLLFVNGFPEEITNKQKISTVYIDYISGGWFEEYIYYNLQKTNPQDLLLNVRATNLLNNEFDVFMLKNNILYFIECKTSVKVPKGNIINDTLYKLDSISHPAGLTARKILMCLDEEIFNKESVRNRAKQTRIKIITGSQLIPESIVEQFMRL